MAIKNMGDPLEKYTIKQLVEKVDDMLGEIEVYSLVIADNRMDDINNYGFICKCYIKDLNLVVDASFDDYEIIAGDINEFIKWTDEDASYEGFKKLNGCKMKMENNLTI